METRAFRVFHINFNATGDKGPDSLCWADHNLNLYGSVLLMDIYGLNLGVYR